VRCLGKEGTRAVVISHEAEATQRLLSRAHFYLKHLKGPPPEFGRNSRNEMYFSKTESTFYIGTAGAKAFGRGDTITDLHASEYAFWDETERHHAGLFQAVPMDGRIYIESTGNGRKNDFYYIWQHADSMGYTRLFYPWFADSEYSLPLPPHVKEWKPDIPQYASYLLELKHKHKLTDEQMFWYETKLKELRENIALMQQEYPSDPDECFQATGGSVFQGVTLTPSHAWRQAQFGGHYISKLSGHPKPGFHYVLGADPAGGTGHDDSAINVFCAETWEQVFEFFNNRINPLDFARLLIEVGHAYNTAYIVCEGNNHGAAIIPYIKENYPRTAIYKSRLSTKSTPARYGWFNTTFTKHELVGLMQEFLDQLTIYGHQTVRELESFEEVEEGRFAGKQDNLVIATGLAILGLKRFEYLREQYLNPPEVKKIERPKSYMYYTFDEIVDNLRQRRYPLDKFARHLGYAR